ncbi:two-component system, chemotaxis family, sensor kinase CheA [Gammaproteobacteria bacterium]
MAHTANPSEIFKQEAADLLIQLETSLLDLENSPDNLELVDQAFRALHTIKGSGAMFGWDALASFTHHIESAFQKVRDGTLAASADLVSLTLAALDHLRILLEHPEQADRVRGGALLAAFADLTAGTGHSSSQKSLTPTPSPASPTPLPNLERIFHIRWYPSRDMLEFGGNPLLLLDELRALGPCTVVPMTDRVPLLPNLESTKCYLGWDLMLTTRANRATLDDIFIFVADRSELVIDELPFEKDASPPRLGEILVKRGDIAPADVEEELQRQQRLGTMLVQSGKVSKDHLAAALSEQNHLAQAAKARESATSGSTIRVPAERLDSLMDQVGELVIAQARLQQVAATENSPLLKSIAEDIERLAAGLRDTTMSVRMLPIGTLFGRFRRVVHDLSHELGKSVELTTSGEETELDKTVIENLNDPLVHLIRNSIDHGIEDKAQRQAHDKPVSGKLHLSAIHSGAQVLITIEDDGRGLDRTAIRAKAEERGLLQSGQEVSEAELFACIFQPGLSTATTVTNMSGRGVGMDVVKRTIDSLRGSIDISSTIGRGTAITLKLPLTLAIIDGLLVRMGDERYVIPLTAVEECVELTRQENDRSDGRSFLNIRGEIVAFIRLRQLFNMPGTVPDIQKVVIVAFGESRIGLVVDQVIGQHQTVIKSLSRLHRDLEGFSGATILGDGGVSLILDIPHLIQFARERETTLRMGAVPQTPVRQ